MRIRQIKRIFALNLIIQRCGESQANKKTKTRMRWRVFVKCYPNKYLKPAAGYLVLQLAFLRVVFFAQAGAFFVSFQRAGVGLVIAKFLIGAVGSTGI